MKTVQDIFEKLPNSAPIWVESVDGLDEARKKVRELRSRTKREYFIYSEHNGMIQREDH